jgi:hypothetical protein
MADGIEITAGSGTKILTDDTGAAGHAQVFKLAISADGSGTLIPADATNGIDVDVTRVIPGTTATALGKAEDAAHTDGDTGVLMLGVRGYTGAGTSGAYSALSVSTDGHLMVEPHSNLVRIVATSTGLTTSVTNYTAGDQVGAQMTLAGAARAAGGFGYITGIVLISAADIIGAYDVLITRESVTPAADNAAFLISDADALKIVQLIPLSGAYDIGDNRVAQAQNLRIPYDCVATSLFANLITRSGHAFFGAVGDLQLVVYVELA